jgi:hypothetical protein
MTGSIQNFFAEKQKFTTSMMLERPNKSFVDSFRASGSV